ncbi:Glu-tRNA(Gln) amidotransferase GatDE subunit E [Candidatus Woesearchaeota archaeon]|nr:MAG: Glu-tRNA(Gln) amidotransferase GatDE subunit E [Candidatus Woesearchaeota archaeon]
MAEINYKEIGLKCGLEIHQQLDTQKLFCSCPSQLYDGEPDFVMKRRIRAVAGETGDVDVAAMHEMQKEKQYVYEGIFQNTCLVETDEEPPHDINHYALQIALQVAKMTSAKFVDQIQVMRKTVADGSNTSGFQRTALIARDGIIAVNGKHIRIPTICIEEDAARIIKDAKHFTVYRLDRLGIPLIEIATHADIATPQMCREVAEYLGMLLRSTGKVKRGLGTIRQDVNVSIKGGARIEIKGAQDLKQLQLLVENEVLRQISLLELKRTLMLPKKTIAIKEATELFANTNVNILRDKPVFGIKLEHFKGFLKKEIQPNKRLGTELSDYAKTKGVLGLFHSDETLENYGLTKEEIKHTADFFELEKDDAFILIAEEKKIAEKALQAVIDRIYLLFEKIPSEVRRANIDGTSTYLRPMPGSSRMYPETDVKPVIPETENIEIPQLLEEKKDDYKKAGLSEDLAKLAVKKGIALDDLMRNYPNVDPVFLAYYFLNMPKEIKKRFTIEVDVRKYAVELLTKVNKEEIPQEAVIDIVVSLAQGHKVNYSAYAFSEHDFKETMRRIVAEHPDATVSGLMGEAMKVLRGRVPGKKVMDMLKQLKEE